MFRFLAFCMLNLIVWAVCYSVQFPVPCPSGEFNDSFDQQNTTTFKYIRVANEYEVGPLSIRTALNSFCLSVLIVLSCLAIPLALTLLSTRVVAKNEQINDLGEGGKSNTSGDEYVSSADKESAGTDEREETALQSADFSIIDQEIATFLEFGKSFLSPDFLKEIMGKESNSDVCDNSPVGGPPSPPTSQPDDFAPPPGFENSRPSRSKPHCDVRNWRSCDRKPSLSNTRTLSAFHNLNASRKVAHHFYPNFGPASGQSNDAHRNVHKNHRGSL